MQGEGEDLLPLSALQHFLFCPRQCALIHVERAWAENVLTAEGRLQHEVVHSAKDERRRGVRTVTSMPLRSERLGAAGVADVVELHKDGARWRPFPVEHKRGRPKDHRADEVQLCAQALCLEEMFGAGVPEGALFYGKERRRTNVAFDADLRALTLGVAKRARAMIASGLTPAATYEKKRCDACSLFDLCRPKAPGRGVARYLERMIES